jgi:hypothetical protein
MNIAADFGKRARPSGISDWFREQAHRGGHRLVDDVHGLMTFEDDPWPTFFGVGGFELSTGRLIRPVVDAIEAAACLPTDWSDREETAFDLYAASFFVSIDDARFTMLMMALETLMEPKPRSSQTRDFVDALIATAETADVPENDKRSIVGSLGFLKDESFRQAGLRLVGCLGARQYRGTSAREFFDAVYQLRSGLVHGAHPRPAQALVNASVAELERLVSDLLAVDLLDEADS